MTATIIHADFGKARARRYGESRYPNWPYEGRAYRPRMAGDATHVRRPSACGALVFLLAWWATVGWVAFGGPWR